MTGSWQDDARCATVGVAVMFPDGIGGEATLQTAEAKAVCTHCRVQLDCLDYALDREGDSTEHFRSGIYGGKTPGERAELARQRKRVDA